MSISHKVAQEVRKPVFGSVLCIYPSLPPWPRSVSKQQAVIPSQVFELADSSSSYQDFSLTRNNRFSNAQSSRNIIQPPATILHFYNAPPTLNEHQLHKVEAVYYLGVL